MKSRLLVSVGLCAIIIGAGAGVVAVVVEPGASKAEAKSPETRIPSVRVDALQAITLEDSVTLTGSVEAWQDVVVSAETTGKIESQGVEEGDAVKAGQELFHIDTEQIQARLAQARAGLKLAEQEFERAQSLKNRGAGTDQALDAAVAQRDSASADLKLLEIQLAKSVVKAPFDGIVDTRFKDKDEFVDTGMPLAHMVQVHKVKVKAGIPERDVPFFALGDKVKVRLDALPGKECEGTIRRIATSADPMTHTFTAEIEVDNAEGCLRPGMVARTDMVRQVFPDSIVVPIFATILLDEQRYAFVEEKGMAHLRPIEVGVVKGSSVQVTKGLAAGDHLIISGQFDVRDGGAVEVQEGAQS